MLDDASAPLDASIDDARSLLFQQIKSQPIEIHTKRLKLD